MIQALNIVEKAALSGLITAGASAITTGARWSVPCPSLLGFGRGRTCPLFVFAGLAGILSSVVNDGVHYLVKNEIHINKKAQDDASLYLGAVIGAVSYYGVIYAINPFLVRDIGTWTILATGTGAETLSNFTYDYLKG